MDFTSHNILLDNGKTTMNNQMLMSDSVLWKSIGKTIDLLIPLNKNDRSKMNVVDLGCLEGGFAIEFARLGFITLGIDAREENIEKSNFAKSGLSLPNINYVQDDVRNLSNYGKFDIALCSGLLYHLNDPVSFLRTISKCTTQILFLNTHFADERDFRYDFGKLNNYVFAPIQKRLKFLGQKNNYRLSKLSSNEGYKGRWFREWNKNDDEEKIKKMLWASHNNHKSFWLCKKDLIKVLNEVGFNTIFEQFDFTGDIFPENFIEHNNRIMLVAVKH